MDSNADDKQPSLAGNRDTHDPLPYLVRLRVALTDDAVPEIQEIRVVAYSLSEAMMQAFIAVTGNGVIDSKVRVESIAPDEPEYWTRMLGNTIARFVANLRGR